MPWKFWKDRGPADPPTSAPPEDGEILNAVRALQDDAGSEAFAPIYRRFRRPLLYFFTGQGLPRDEAEDLVQITFLRAYEGIGQYRFEAKLETWLRQIGENVWRNAARDARAAKRDALLEPLEPADAEGHVASTLADGGPTPEQAALAEERRRVLQEAVETLPPGMRLCTELRVYQDLQYQEISRVTGIGLNSVRSQLFEARKRLEPVLAKYFQGADL